MFNCCSKAIGFFTVKFDLWTAVCTLSSGPNLRNGTENAQVEMQIPSIYAKCGESTWGLDARMQQSLSQLHA